jgi:ABC-2 type transport system permease protein
MRELALLMKPAWWSLRNSIVRLNRAFYRRAVFYGIAGALFLYSLTSVLLAAMTKMHAMSGDLFDLMLIKGYSLVLAIIFLVQIAGGFVIGLSAFFQAGDLVVLLASPVNRTAFFFSRLLEVHVRSSWMLVIFGMPLLFSAGLFYRAPLFYYATALLLLAAFSAIAVNIGAALAIFLSRFYHVRRMKKLLFSSGLVAAAALVTVLRILRPERFVNPELFANLTLFIAELKSPAFVILPNRWLSEAVSAFLGTPGGSGAFAFVALLILTPYVSGLFVAAIFKRYYYQGWSMLQDGELMSGRRRFGVGSGTSVSGRTRTAPAALVLSSFFGSKTLTIMRKDYVSQIRDPGNVHQILILLSLIAIYLFSVASLPLNWVGYEVQLKYVVSFMDLALILIIVASLCSHIVYPAVVSEERSFWIVKTSPVTPGHYVGAKFLFFLVPVFLTGQLLSISSSLIIGSERTFMILKAVTTGLLSMSLVGMAVYFGTAHMNPGEGRTAGRERPTESAAYILCAVFLIFLTMAVEIAPVFLYFLRESEQASLTWKAWTVIGGAAFLLFVMNLFVTVVSLYLSAKKMDEFDL